MKRGPPGVTAQRRASGSPEVGQKSSRAARAAKICAAKTAAASWVRRAALPSQRARPGRVSEHGTDGFFDQVLEVGEEGGAVQDAVID